MNRLYRRIGALALAVSLLAASGCSRPEREPAFSGQIYEGNWGEAPDGNETLPGEFTMAATEGRTTSETGTAAASGAASKPTGTGGTAPPQKPGSTATATKAASTATKAPAPVLNGELRGMWLCHLDTNVMFKNKTETQARAALDKVMDNCVSYGMNAVFFHVRPDSNAYYKSNIFRPAAVVEKLIKGGFDPLAYAVEAAHKRGLQLHAWINPYRIGSDESYAVGSEEDRFWKYDKVTNGTYTGKDWYYIPSSTGAQKSILDGIREIVGGYDVDGVHFDDYFYPNSSDPKLGINAKQPESFETGYKPGGGMSLGDWRRAAVDSLVSQAYSIVHRKKNCVFGISPSHNIQRARDTEYADIPKWLAGKGYVDYLCPQIYFGFEHNSSAFDKRVQEWAAMPRNPNVGVLVGMAIYKIGIPDDEWANRDLPYGTGARAEWAKSGDLMKREVEYLRKQTGINGMLFFRYRYFDPVEMGILKGDNLETAKKEIQNLLPLLKK